MQPTGQKTLELKLIDREKIEQEIRGMELWFKDLDKTGFSRHKGNSRWSIATVGKRIIQVLEGYRWLFVHIWRSIFLKVNPAVGDISFQIRGNWRLEDDAELLWEEGFSQKSLQIYLRLLGNRQRSYAASNLIPTGIGLVSFYLWPLPSSILLVLSSPYIIWVAGVRAKNNRWTDIVSLAIEIEQERGPYLKFSANS